MGDCNLSYSYGDTTYQTMGDGQTFATYCPVAQCGYDCDGTIVFGVNGITGGTLCDGDGGGCDQN
jgi:hypothetical protein